MVHVGRWEWQVVTGGWWGMTQISLQEQFELCSIDLQTGNGELRSTAGTPIIWASWKLHLA